MVDAGQAGVYIDNTLKEGERLQTEKASRRSC